MNASEQQETDTNETSISPGQIRAARAMLNWRQTDLAKASGVSEITIKNIERGASKAKAQTLGQIEKSFNDAGLVILSKNDKTGNGAGVRLKT